MSSPLRLVHITTVAESLRFLRGQPAFLAERGFSVHAITSPGPLVESMSGELGIPIHTVPMPRAITPAADLVALGQLVGHLLRIRPHIVHAHTPKAGLLGMLAATLTGVPVRVYHMRGLPMQTAEGWKRALLSTTERTSCALAHQVIAVGESLRSFAVAEGLCAPERIAVLANGSGQGVDAMGRFNPDGVSPRIVDDLRHQWSIAADRPVVGFVGRLVADKGIIELLEAWRSLRAHPSNPQLLLVGPLEERDGLPADVRDELSEDPSIVTVGNQQEIEKFYALMDLVVLPTHREGFPNVPLEAAAMGLAVAASNIAPCQEAVAEGETGVLFECGSAEGITSRVTAYLDDPALRARHGAAGRRRVVEHFSPELIQHELAACYDRLVTTSAAL